MPPSNIFGILLIGMVLMNILVLGACGFVGMGITGYLKRCGYLVYGFDDSDKIGKTRYDGELFCLNVLKQNGNDNPLILADVIINCYGEISLTGALREKNVQTIDEICMTIGKTRSPEQRLIRWIQISSVGVYGCSRCFSKNSDDSVVIEPQSLLNPTNQYEQTKADGDLLLLNLHGRIIDLTLLRASSIIDETMRNDFLRRLIKAVRYRYFAYINDRNYRFNWLALSDLVYVVKACISDDRSSGKTYLVSEDIPQNAVILSIMKFFGLRVRPLVISQHMIFPICNLIDFVMGTNLFFRQAQNMTINVRYDSSSIEKLIGKKLDGCQGAVTNLLEVRFARRE